MFQPVIDISKKISIMFQHRNLEDFLMKVLKLAAIKNSLAPALNHINTKLQVQFYRSCLN